MGVIAAQGEKHGDFHGRQIFRHRAGAKRLGLLALLWGLRFLVRRALGTGAYQQKQREACGEAFQIFQLVDCLHSIIPICSFLCLTIMQRTMMILKRSL